MAFSVFVLFDSFVCYGWCVCGMAVRLYRRVRKGDGIYRGLPLAMECVSLDVLRRSEKC